MPEVRLAVVLSPDPIERTRMAAAIAGAWRREHADALVAGTPPARYWPFIHPLALAPADRPMVVWMPDVHEAFVDEQTGGTRLVTTQPGYIFQAWLDAAGTRRVLLVATADPTALGSDEADLVGRRGPFAEARVHDASTEPWTFDPSAGDVDLPAVSPPSPSGSALELLAAAFKGGDASERLALSVRALDHSRTPAALVATASACMEVNDLDAAGRDLDEALRLAPEWPAAHFERGKLWLRADDMERAGESFRRAAERMPRFGPAWANLGATLGELDRAGDALQAFERALECDPASAQTVNNIGVVQRELGKLSQSEASFRRVTVLAPDRAFGYYNLGHTLFLQGRYQVALNAYVEGQKRDPERNAVQASRLAICRLATGDAAGALRELQRTVAPLATDYRRQLLADTNALAWALLTSRPDLAGWRQVNDWLSRELAKLA